MKVSNKLPEGPVSLLLARSAGLVLFLLAKSLEALSGISVFVNASGRCALANGSGKPVT